MPPPIPLNNFTSSQKALPTPLTTVSSCQSIFGLSALDAANTALISLYITEATQIICEYCGVKDFALAFQTEPISGNNAPAITVRHVPLQGFVFDNLTCTANSSVITGFPTVLSQQYVFLNQSVLGPAFNTGVGITVVTPPQITLSANATATATGVTLTDTSANITFTGNTTSGSPTITNVSSITGLVVGDTVTGSGIPVSTTIAAAGITTGSVTVSSPATITTTGSLIFDFALFADDNAFGGAAPGAFGNGTLLYEGQDYYVDWDTGPGSISTSGVIYRLGYYWFRPSVWYAGLITPQDGPPTQNLFLQYFSGYDTIPVSLSAACELLVAKMRQTRMYGQGVESMSRDGLSVSLSKQDAKEAQLGLLTQEITGTLNRFKKIQIAG